jgi:hypothetical protein
VKAEHCGGRRSFSAIRHTKEVFDWLLANPATKGPGPAVGANGENQR